MEGISKNFCQYFCLSVNFPDFLTTLGASDRLINDVKLLFVLELANCISSNVQV